jgi:CRISPR/Cas system-associated exonuclease Cas4 (RecB family)
LINEVRTRLESEGRTVWTEGQNKFHFDGRAATVGGKADLVSRNGDGLYSVHDAKTGRPKDADVVQIQLYIFFLRLANGRYKGVEMDGWVEYKDSRVYVPTESVNQEFKERTVDLIKRLASIEPARVVPSESDCRYCDLTLADCPSRIDTEEVRTVTELF